ncbi:Glu/Leu/Phe/Val family dehydrogenase [Shimia aestuarii]|uniref:Leucine dehydrogenase n=1 Tax=Shimia aestuarii TaxID=254406 RepID=A0A1I4TTV3_9RHOB|nr:Glu/Leu/Phe/Val dehydrogenase dimerization domain-containing protein [Shimia aestuarii]SFM80186.1 leucine dehydrogenase [Shimia aestuarii]
MSATPEITRLEVASHETVLRVHDGALGLTGFIALHSTHRGPAAGGLRMRAYASEDAALTDALRLSEGMTYKNAAAGLPLGGGKAVIMGDPATKTPDQLRAFARAIDTLGGRYWTAEDMGMSPADMAVMAGETRFVAGLPDGKFASGDPSPITARGIFNAIRITARHRLGSDDLTGRRVAVQGLGHVGAHLCDLLNRAGTRLIVADIDAARVAETQARYGAETATADGILAVEADILAPCAIGAILNADTIPTLRVAAVAGGANNQLATPEDGARLHDRGILYAPDFVANGGGIINVATEILAIEDRAGFVDEKLAALEVTMDRILTRAAQTNRSPDAVATAIVDEMPQARAA